MSQHEVYTINDYSLHENVAHKNGINVSVGLNNELIESTSSKGDNIILKDVKLEHLNHNGEILL